MKKFRFLWSLMVLLLLAACSQDDIVTSDPGNGKIPEGEGVYITVNFSPFNKGSRSYTNGENSSNGGTEEGTIGENGTTNENRIQSVLIVLATKSNKYIASALVDGSGQSSLNATNEKETMYQANACFQKTKIKGFYDLSEVKTYISEHPGENIPVRIFLYCNPTEEIRDYFKNEVRDWSDQWEKKTYKLTDTKDETLWTQGYFLMTNEEIAKRYFPHSFNGWNNFTKVTNPFNLSGINNKDESSEIDNSGSIRVHRVAARFDFRDGSQTEGGNGISGEEFTYKVIMDDNEESGCLVKAKLINMSLVNMLNEVYYLERVSTETTNWDNEYELLEPEKPWFISVDPLNPTETGGNYVVTPKSEERQALATSKNFATYYKYPFFTSNGEVASRGQGWYTTPMSEFKNTTLHPKDNLMGSYQRWRYVTENTLAGGADDQVNGASTGIVFKAQLLPGDALAANKETNYWDRQLYETLSNTTSNGPVIFAYSSKLIYVSWSHVQYAALKSAGYVEGATTQNLRRDDTFYKAVFGTGGAGTVHITTESGAEYTFTDDMEEDVNAPNYLHSFLDHTGNIPNTDPNNEAWQNFRAAAVANLFTIYEKYGEDTTNDENKDKWGYYCYYYYWNRHNDNGNNEVMAEMEFAVVRNNVYKLAVTKLSALGHPRIPENDPDKPTPETPDEKSDLYMTVTVEVLPWVVRYNNIEF